MSQNSALVRYASVNAAAEDQQTGFEALFAEHYGPVARTIAGVIRDPGRAEELAVEVFLRFQDLPAERQTTPAAWLHRTAIRLGLDELRRRERGKTIERLVRFFQAPLTPEQLYVTQNAQDRVGTVLSKLRRRDAELLLLRADGMSYEELASTLSLNAGSVGTLLSRAQFAFRKEYTKRYGSTY